MSFTHLHHNSTLKCTFLNFKIARGVNSRTVILLNMSKLWAFNNIIEPTIIYLFFNNGLIEQCCLTERRLYLALIVLFVQCRYLTAQKQFKLLRFLNMAKVFLKIHKVKKKKKNFQWCATILTIFCSLLQVPHTQWISICNFLVILWNKVFTK